MAAIGTTLHGRAMPKQMTFRRLKMAETCTNYASHVSGKDIQNRNSILGQILRARRMTPAARPKHRKSYRVILNTLKVTFS